MLLQLNYYLENRIYNELHLYFKIGNEFTFELSFSVNYFQVQLLFPQRAESIQSTENFEGIYISKEVGGKGAGEE